MSDAPIIHWFRRDLRLTDNTALNAALATGSPVIPVFIFDPAILNSDRLGVPRLAFMLKGLRSLRESLNDQGSNLFIRHGDPVTALEKLIDETGAVAIYYNRDYTPYARTRDNAVMAELRVPVYGFDDVLVHAPGEILTSAEAPYVVFTPFKKRWWELMKRPVQALLPSGRFTDCEELDGGELPTLRVLGFDGTIPVPDASETVAQRRLAAFVEGPIYDYGEARNRLVANPFEDETSATSALSPYLRMGILSARQAVEVAYNLLSERQSKAAQRSIESWVDELAWRDFYAHIMYHFPRVDRGYFREEFEAVEYRHDADDLAAWKDGCTGYPIVDAAMRQLQGIGWMHNRARMVVASFLTKDLLTDWREGERYFMQWLIDGDPASNNGGWQWSAGTGTDAQPYFRIFNPVSQSKKFDPDGDYIRYWLPELRDVPTEYIHEPWAMSLPPSPYPAPIVDHAFARERALDALGSIKRKQAEPG